MAYNEKHLVKLADLKALGTKQKEVADALAARVDTLENVGSQANVLEGVKVNGTALAIANKMVDILIATGSKNGSISVNGADVAIKGLAALAFKAKVSQSDLDDALAAVLEGKADKATTLDGYGITNGVKADKTEFVSFSIPATGWKTDSSVPGYTNYIDIANSGLTAADYVAVDVAPASSAVARAANFVATESRAGILRLRAASVPTATISAQYHIITAATAAKEG